MSYKITETSALAIAACGCPIRDDWHAVGDEINLEQPIKAGEQFEIEAYPTVGKIRIIRANAE